LAATEPPKRKIVFVTYPGMTLLDLVGPLEVLNRLGPAFETVLVGEKTEPLATNLPIQVTPMSNYAEVPDPYVVIVPGGSVGTIRAMRDQPLLDYLIAADKNAIVVGSVCTGSLILAAAGLLNGKMATTHWSYGTFLSRLGAKYERKRWVHDGKYFTSAGVSAGIDMALALAAHLVGDATAGKIQLGLEYDPQPPARIDWSKVRMDVRVPSIIETMKKELANRPDLLERLGAKDDPVKVFGVKV
jgi:transcriptional regulator GlxA family with amidase domain